MKRFTGKHSVRRTIAGRRRRWRRARGSIAAVATLAVSAVLLGPVPAASAGTLNLVVTPIDTSDSSVITSIQDGTHANRITYRVQFSCQSTACTDAQVQFSPSQPDPWGLLPSGRYLLSYDSFVPPAGGGSIAGSDETGKTVSLGDLAAGESGSFDVTYAIPTDVYRQVPYGSFYPDGFQIEMAATLSSSNSTAVTVDAPPVTWNVELPPATFPAVGIAAPASTQPDTDVTYRLTMGPGNMAVVSQDLNGLADRQAIGNYTVVYHLPAEADFVSAELGGTYDSVAHTVTWQQGTLADPVYGARGGFGVNQTNGGFYGGGAGTDNPAGAVLGDDDYAYFYQRAVVLNFPAENFDDADAEGCNFSAEVTSTIEVEVGYLDAARTTRTNSFDRTVQVACWDAFVGVDVQKYVSGGSWVNPIYMVNRPAPGNPPLTAYWYAQVSNQGNVPAVAVIDEPNLSQPDAQVYQIWPSGIGATIEWTRSDGVSGTSTLAHNQSVTAPAGTWFTSATATTDPIPAGRIQPTDTTSTTVYIDYRFRVTDAAPLGEQRTNTANVEIDYPGVTSPVPDTSGTPVTLPIERTVSRTIQFSQPSPIVNAAFPSAPVVGGPSLTPGTPVTYTAAGSTEQIWPGTEIVPQYVYVAPVGWDIVPGTASLGAGAPVGVTYDYRTAVVGGVSRAVVVATWPSAIAPSTTGVETWPQLTVQATPTASASTAFNAATALIWAGDASGTLSDSIGASQAYITADDQFRARPATGLDSGDADDDGNSTEEFAQATSAPLTVVGGTGLQVLKELCIPDDAAPDGCAWTADTSTPHLVPRTADDITYRITVTNFGSSALTDVVAYDVLPHVGDVSLTPDATPRGSEFGLTIQSVESVSPGVTMAYSASTNPVRPEVYPGAPGTVDDWGTDPDGMVAARITVGTLPGGQSRSLVIVAATDGTGAADEQACNSVAIDSAQTLPTEPTAVCVTLAEADLEIELTEFQNLQAGRPSTLGYAVTNLGGSAEAPATVEIGVPRGLTVGDLTVPGWDCTVSGGGAAPVEGPATLVCAPVDDTDQPRLLERDEAETLEFPVVVTVDDGELCTSGEVTGTLFDPDEGNNSIVGCLDVAEPPAGLVIAKDDGQTATQIGAEYTYTITVTNTLLGEAVSDAEVTDTLPDSLELVSATGGPAVSGQTLTWALADLPPLAEVELRVTVRVLGSAVSPVVNEASVSAPDPGFPDETLTDSAEDSNDVLRLSVDKTSDAPASGVRQGDVITYTVTVTGDDAGDYAGAAITDDLTDVLDEAVFVAGSASLSVDGGAAQAVADPVGDLLTWTGVVPAGVEAVLTYQVTAGEPADGQLVNAVSTSADPTDCDTTTGLDEDGLACAVLATPFAPTIAKTVESLTQSDDGSWTIQYGIDVVNPAPTDTTYDLSDALAFGPGITVSSASVTPPAGITPETWTGSGDITLGADLPAGTTHHYTVTVVADAGTVAGTAAAACTPDAALGFANTATLTLSDGAERQAEACAEPAEPTVTKTLDGAPVQGADGRWTVTYLITVTNAAEQPDGGLAYHLQDALDFPAGLTVDDVQVTPPAGVTANDGFTGGLTEIGGATVTADPELVDGVARIPAATGGDAAVQEYRVRLVVTAGAGSVDPAMLGCGPAGAGYGNWVALLAGSTELGRATACADIRLPELQFTKVADTSGGTGPGDRIHYTIVATNTGDADFTPGDPAELVDDMSGLLDDAGYLGDAAADGGTVAWARPTLTWTGPLAAGSTVEIRYTVLLADTGAGDGDIVNQVHLTGAGAPAGTVPDCADTPAGNAGEPACEVVLALDTRTPPGGTPDDPPGTLAVTGMFVPLTALFGAFSSIVAGIVLIAFTRRGRRSAGSL